ncbi:MAG: helix-turn-helix domain-containing protein [Clostridiales bacterium]|nr:helix-turn-helix domain-containing protein [Clostridiales bacterium]
MSTQDQEILTVFDVTQILHIGKNRVYELLSSNELNGFRIGRVWKIPRGNLDEYILRQSKIKKETT